ncbi:hypothetical protein J6590_024419 [Homalodisca vitripennis]|nr:hypothetical protein J6590_024419 [Homalodisca vitripennis]
MITGSTAWDLWIVVPQGGTHVQEVIVTTSTCALSSGRATTGSSTSSRSSRLQLCPPYSSHYIISNCCVAPTAVASKWIPYLMQWQLSIPTTAMRYTGDRERSVKPVKYSYGRNR